MRLLIVVVDVVSFFLRAYLLKMPYFRLFCLLCTYLSADMGRALAPLSSLLSAGDQTDCFVPEQHGGGVPRRECYFP